MSRLITIKTLSVIRKVDIDPATLNACLVELAGFLRKSNRPLRQAALTTLKVAQPFFLSPYPGAVPQNQNGQVTD